MNSDLSQLIDDLAAPDPATRSQAAERLSQLGSDAQPAAVALVRACGDPEEEVLQWATGALEALGPPLVSGVDQLAALIDDQSPDVAYWAATLLGRLTAAAAPAVEVLTHAVAGTADLSVRQRAAWALGEIGPAAAAALPALRQAVTDPDPRLSRLAQQAIDRIAGR